MRSVFQHGGGSVMAVADAQPGEQAAARGHHGGPGTPQDPVPCARHVRGLLDDPQG